MTEQLTLNLDARLDAVATRQADHAQRLDALDAAHLPSGQPAERPRMATTAETPDAGADPGPGGSVAAGPAEWEGQTIRLVDLPDYKRRWGLQVVGSEWPRGQPGPVVYLAEV